MRKVWAAMVVLMAGGSGRAAAQDSAIVDGPRAEQLRQLIEERFAERLNQELGLSPDQSGRVRGILATWGAKRRGLEREERELRQRLGTAMRPGVAANEQAVTRMVDAIMAARLAYVQTFKDELVDLAQVLSPVQRAQYVLLRDRLAQRIQEVREQRRVGPLLGRRNRLPP